MNVEAGDNCVGNCYPGIRDSVNATECLPAPADSERTDASSVTSKLLTKRQNESDHLKL